MLRHYINMSCQDDEPDAGARQLLGGKPGPKLPPKPRAGGGTSPLHLASCRGHVGVVHELLSAGADATRGDQFGYSALHLAAKHGFPDVISEMLSFSAVDVNLLDENGETPLHTAARYSKTLCLSRLLEHGGDFGIRSRSGRRPTDVVGQPQDKHGRQSMPHSATQLEGTGGCRRSHKFNTNLPPPQLPRDRCTEERIRRLLRAAEEGAEDGWMWPATGGGEIEPADAVDEGVGDVGEETPESAAADCAAGACAKPREAATAVASKSHMATIAMEAAAAEAAGVAAASQRPFSPVHILSAASPERKQRESEANGEQRPPHDERASAAGATGAAGAAAAPEPIPATIVVSESHHRDTSTFPVAVAVANGRGGSAPAGADAAGGDMRCPASPHGGTRCHSSSNDDRTALFVKGGATASASDSSSGKGRVANCCVCTRENGVAAGRSVDGGAVAGVGATHGAKTPLPLGRLNMRRLRKGTDGQGDVNVLKAISRYTHATPSRPWGGGVALDR